MSKEIEISETEIPKIKKKIKEKDFFQMDEEISMLPYQLGDNYDYWYPTFQEILENVDYNSLEGIRFLLWCTHPRKEFEQKMTPEQKDCMKKIKKMLYSVTLIPES